MDSFTYMTSKSAVLALLKMRSESVCGELFECEDQRLGWEELRRFGSNPYERELTIKQGVPDDTKNNNQSRQKRCRV